MDIINYNALYIQKDDGNDEPLFYNNETKRYIEIKYEVKKIKWNLE